MFTAKQFEKFYQGFLIEGGYKNVLLGIRNTLIIAFLALAIGFVIGSIIAAINTIKSKNGFVGFLKALCNIYVSVFRGTPIIVQLLLAYYGILGPMFGLSAFWTAIIIFGINSSAYVSEIIRGGINSVDIGQMEGARSLGLSYPVSMLKIILPQAIKNALPTLGNEFISLLKETSVCLYIGVVDLTNAYNMIAASKIEYFVTFTVLALNYLVLVYLASLIFKFIERRLRKSDKR
ncbi:MAG: amino acid ABC transporter permease [Christensenellaceae bacterium]